MEHMQNNTEGSTEEKRVSFKDRTHMKDIDNPDGRMSPSTDVYYLILINRFNWCVAGANSTCLTGTSAPAGLLLSTLSWLRLDRFYKPQVHGEGSMQTERRHSEPLRATISASDCIHSSQQHEAERFEYIALPVAVSRSTEKAELIALLTRISPQRSYT